MNMIATPPPMTAEQFDEIDHHGYELVDGKLLEKGMGLESSLIQSMLSHELWSWVRPRNLGYVFDSEAIYRCFPGKPDQTRKPDVSFIRQDRIAGSRVTTGVSTIAADLVVELVSPNEFAYDLHAKLADHQSAGVPLIWVIFPNLLTVDVYQNGSPTRHLTAADELIGDPVLPGFRVKVADLFPPAAPTAS